YECETAPADREDEAGVTGRVVQVRHEQGRRQHGEGEGGAAAVPERERADHLPVADPDPVREEMTAAAPAPHATIPLSAHPPRTPSTSPIPTGGKRPVGPGPRRGPPRRECSVSPRPPFTLPP